MAHSDLYSFRRVERHLSKERQGRGRLAFGSGWMSGRKIAPRRLFAEVPEIAPRQIPAVVPELLGEDVETTAERKEKTWGTASLPGRWELLMRAERTTSVGGFIVKMDVGNDAG